MGGELWRSGAEAGGGEAEGGGGRPAGVAPSSPPAVAIAR